MVKRLCNESLVDVPRHVERPRYDRGRLKPRIAHIGIGNFHRAHQAWYTDEALNRGGDPDWGICGISLRNPRVRDRLMPQDGLYALEVRDNDERRCRIIGSVIDVRVGPEDPSAVIRSLAEADVATLTVTEKAYCLDAAGALDPAHPDIAHDLAEPHAPISVVGYLAAGSRMRRELGNGPLTIVCCDNMTDNGRLLRGAMEQFLEISDPAAGARLRDDAAFPCTMVDRIVPAATPETLEEVSAELGMQDRAAVVTEPFSQWVIENRFASPVPDWAGSGALVVDDVMPFETAKLRMLNGSHSSLAYLGCLGDIPTVAEAIADPRMRAFIERLMRDEIQPTLRAPRGLRLDRYREDLLARFANTATRHRLRQIAMDGSQKLRPRLLGTVRDQLERGGSVRCLALAVAAWIRFLRGTSLSGQPHEIEDPLADRLATWSEEAGNDVVAFMRSSQLFGEDLPAQGRFTRLIRHWMQELEAGDLAAVLGQAVDSGAQ